jgi:hypothetical protein
MVYGSKAATRKERQRATGNETRRPGWADAHRGLARGKARQRSGCGRDDLVLDSRLAVHKNADSKMEQSVSKQYYSVISLCIDQSLCDRSVINVQWSRFMT